MSDLETIQTRVARAQAVIDAYGARSEGWPEEEREALLAVIATHADLQARLQEAARLDELLMAHEACTRTTHHDHARLRTRVLEATLPRKRWQLVLPLAAAASLSAVLVLSQIGALAPTPPVQISGSFEQWAWEEVLNETPSETTDMLNGDPLNGGGLMELAMLEYDEVF